MMKFYTYSRLFLDGITRQTVIEIAKKRILKVTETRLKVEDLSQYSECFVTGTAEVSQHQLNLTMRYSLTW